MHKKIRVDQLRLGMHVHELTGAWIDHPFWKSKFVLTDPADLLQLRQSGLNECVIDTSKGVDVDIDSPGEVAPKMAVPAVIKPPPAAPTMPDARPEPRVSLQQEMRKAAAVVGQGRQAVMALYGEARMGRALDTSACVDLVNEVASSVFRNPGAIVSLARLKTHDDYSYMHSVAVCALMIALSRKLDMTEAQSLEAGMAGLLHDMGKALMPVEILNKSGKLTAAEFEVIRSHPERGASLLQSGEAVSEAVIDVCLHHHERTDGKGYPHGLVDGQISLLAKMGAVCDVYDAITSNRPYKAGWDPAESIGKMASWRAGHFDERVFQAFVQSLGIYPTGSLVRLRSDRLAVVVEQNEQALTTPIVKVFFSARNQLPVTAELLDLSQPGCTDHITGRESNRVWKFPHLEQLWGADDALKKTARGA